MAAVLATYQHHSAPRGPRTARTGGGARDEQHGYAPEDAHPQAAGTQYFCHLLDVSGPQERVQRRTVQQIVDYPSLPFLDDPAPQMVGQVTEVPKIPRSYRRFVDSLRQPQTAEQLVEVPTIITFSSLQRTVEQNVDMSAVGGSGTGGGLSGFLPGQSYHAGQNDYRYRSEIKSKTIGLYQITDVTDLY